MQKYKSYKIPSKVRFTFLNRNDPSLNTFRNIKQSLQINILCRLCQTSCPQSTMMCISDCRHYFCSSCMHKYVKYKLNVMESVVCPQENCNKEINTRSNCFTTLSHQYKNKYHKLQVWKQTIENPNLKLCPQEQCNGLIDIRSGIYKCQQCNVQYCPQCMLQKHLGPCDINFQQIFSDFKRCPNCHVFIQKNEGCDHMTCRCGYQFCYLCLANWTYEHMCENLQEQWMDDFPQEQIMRQREQIYVTPRWINILYAIAMVLALPSCLALGVIILCVVIPFSTFISVFLGIFMFSICRNLTSEQCSLTRFMAQSRQSWEYVSSNPIMLSIVIIFWPLIGLVLSLLFNLLFIGYMVDRLVRYLSTLFQLFFVL